jgi:hypothetical protein
MITENLKSAIDNLKDQADVSAMEAKIVESAGDIEVHADASIPKSAELEATEPVAEVVDASALENASMPPEEAQAEPVSDTHGGEVRRIPDKLDEVIAKGIAAYDGNPDSECLSKIDYLRDIKKTAVGMSPEARDLLAGTVTYKVKS